MKHGFYVPVFPASSHASKYLKNNSEKALRDICQSHVIENRNKFYVKNGLINISIKKSPPPDKEISRWRLEKSTIRSESEFDWYLIHFEKVDNEDLFDSLEFRFKEGGYRDVYFDEYEYQFIYDVFSDILKLITLSINISCPGCFEYDKFIHVSDKRSSVGFSMFSFFEGTNEYVEYKDKIHFDFIDFSSALYWVSKVENLFDGMPKTSSSNIINAFSHLFYFSVEGDHDSEMMWTMMGLESFYCEGRQVQRDLRARVRKFLGDDISPSDINQLYNIRSRYVHGQTPIYGPWNETRRSAISGNKEIDLQDYFDLAKYILIRTLQKCCKEQIIDIEFEDKVQFNLSIIK